jgi:hypothetical protein
MGKQQAFPIIMVLLAVFSCLVLAEIQSAPEPETGLEGMISVSPVHGGPSRLGVPDSRPLANTAFVVKKGNDTRVRFPSPAFISEEYSIPRVAKRARSQTLRVARLD